jgi:putative chitinase
MRVEPSRYLDHVMARGSLECGAGPEVIENLSHSAQRAHEVWPNRLPTVASAEPCAHNPAQRSTTISIDRPGTTKEANSTLTRKLPGGPAGRDRGRATAANL